MSARKPTPPSRQSHDLYSAASTGAAHNSVLFPQVMTASKHSQSDARGPSPGRVQVFSKPKGLISSSSANTGSKDKLRESAQNAQQLYNGLPLDNAIQELKRATQMNRQKAASKRSNSNSRSSFRRSPFQRDQAYYLAHVQVVNNNQNCASNSKRQTRSGAQKPTRKSQSQEQRGAGLNPNNNSNSNRYQRPTQNNYLQASSSQASFISNRSKLGGLDASGDYTKYTSNRSYVENDLRHSSDQISHNALAASAFVPPQARSTKAPNRFYTPPPARGAVAYKYLRDQIPESRQFEERKKSGRGTELVYSESRGAGVQTSPHSSKIFQPSADTNSTTMPLSLQPYAQNSLAALQKGGTPIGKKAGGMPGESKDTTMLTKGLSLEGAGGLGSTHFNRALTTGHIHATIAFLSAAETQSLEDLHLLHVAFHQRSKQLIGKLDGTRDLKPVETEGDGVLEVLRQEECME